MYKRILKYAFQTFCLVVAAAWSTQAEASHYRGGNITYENLGKLGGSSAEKDWIVIKATLTISQRRSSHCGRTIPTSQGGTSPHTLSCCSSSDLTPCIGRWRGVGGTFQWSSGGKPHPQLSASTPAYRQPTGQNADSFQTNYLEVVAENKSEDALDFRLVLYRIYPPSTQTAMLSWGSCCWIGGANGASGSFQLTTVAQVNSGNLDPVFNAPLLVNACQGVPLKYNLNPSDPDKDDFEVILTTTSNGADQQTPPLTVSKTGEVNWPAPIAGLWVIKVTAYDLNKGTTTRKGASTFRDFLLKVASVCSNKNPIITFTSPDKATVKPGQQACVDVVVTDPDGDNISLRIDPNKPGATVTPASALQPGQTSPLKFKYCWTPSKADEGTTHNIQFTATDSGTPAFSGQKIFGITVSKGGPPSITVSPAGNAKSVDEGKTLVFRVKASDVDSGIDSFGVSGLPPFCQSKNISATEIEITCKPDYTDGDGAGGKKSYELTFTAKDKDGKPKTTTTKVNVTVNNVNRRPTWTSKPDTVGISEQPYKYNAKATDSDTNDKVTYKKTKGPGMLDPKTGELRWTPSAADAGKTFAFEIEACDDGIPQQCIKQSWKVVVGRPNTPPQIVGVPPTQLQATQTLVYQPIARDRDLPNDAHSWTLLNGPKGATIDPKTGKVTWTPSPSDIGKDIVFSVQVCDKGGLCAIQTWKVRVTKGNTPPQILGAPLTTAAKGKLYYYRPKVQDADPNDSHTWKLDKGPTSATIDPKTGELYWTPRAEDEGKLVSFSATVCDSKGACATQTWSVRVKSKAATNTPPRITSLPGAKATAGKAYTYASQLEDPDANDSHTWKLKKAPKGAKIDPNTGKIDWTPSQADVGKVVEFSVEVCDKAGECATQTWQVKVEAGNHPPQIVGAPGNFASAAKLYTFQPSVKDEDTEDMGLHKWAIKQAPVGAKIDPNTGKIDWTPSADDVGKIVTFEIEVCDPSGACAKRKWKVLVTKGNINNPPTILSTPGTQAHANRNYNYAPKATDPDANDSHTWKLKKAPKGAKIDPNTGKIDWTPSANDVGKSATFEVEVCDDKGACDTQSWSVSVGKGNQAPNITTTPPKVGYVGIHLSYDADAKDADANDVHTWTLLKGPAGASIDPKTGEVKWTPAPSDSRKVVQFSVMVCDNAIPKACDIQTYQVKVYQGCRIDSDCPTDEICVTGRCFVPGCSIKQPKCPKGEFCKDSACIPNECDNITCPTGQICRPSDGLCITPCVGVKCSAGSSCVDGHCQADPCANAGANGGPCAKGEICDVADLQRPKCIKDPCAAGKCKHGRLCVLGACIDDPCVSMTCPKSEQRCVAGQCIARQPCQVDVDCPNEQVCLNKRCYPAGCYDSNSQCRHTERCLSAVCRALPCDNKQCGAGEFCRPTDGKCIKPCADVKCAAGELCVDGKCETNPCGNVKCAAGELCVDGKCEKERCNVSGVCKSTRVCNPRSNSCVDDPCANLTCPDAKQICQDGQCIRPPQCTFDKDCPNQQLCVNGKCVIRNCKTNDDCPEDTLCADGACAKNLCQGIICKENEFCRVGKCIPSCAGVFCAKGQRCVDGVCVEDNCADKQCPSGQLCNNGQCINGRCEQDSCRTGRVCLPEGRCSESACAGVECPTGQTCHRGQCSGERKCQFDADCIGDTICENKVCQPQNCYEKACPEGELCLRGKCTKNKCNEAYCDDDEVCRPIDGKCVKQCPACGEGQRCQDGVCQDDPCHQVTCSDKQRCINGQCVATRCNQDNQKSCKYSRICQDDSCNDDPCASMTCGDDQTCRAGTCHDNTSIAPPIEKKEENPPAAKEKQPEERRDEIPQSGSPDAGSIVQHYIAGGCGCSSTQQGQAPFGFFALFLLLVIAGYRRFVA